MTTGGMKYGQGGSIRMIQKRLRQSECEMKILHSAKKYGDIYNFVGLFGKQKLQHGGMK